MCITYIADANNVMQHRLPNPNSDILKQAAAQANILTEGKFQQTCWSYCLSFVNKYMIWTV